MLTDEQKTLAYENLSDIVEEFNKKLSDWMETTGCRANFGWGYSPDDDKDRKFLQIQEIDLPVYKKEVGKNFLNKVKSSTTMDSVLKSYSEESDSGESDT